MIAAPLTGLAEMSCPPPFCPSEVEGSPEGPRSAGRGESLDSAPNEQHGFGPVPSKSCAAKPLPCS